MTFMPQYAGAAPTGAAGGDLAGTYPNPTVAVTHLSAALPIAQGGTNAATAAAALTSLGAAPSGTDVNTNGQVTATHLASALPYAQGGSNAITQAGLIANAVLLTDEPTNCIARRMPRMLVTSGTLAVSNTTGQVGVAAMPLAAGMVVNNITVIVGTTAASGPTHFWLALLDSTLHVLAVSADNLTGALAANTPITLAMGTPFTIVTTGLYYAALSTSASTTAPTWGGVALLSGINGTASWPASTPFLCGTAGTQVAPPALAAQLNSGTISGAGGSSQNFAAWLS